MNFASLKRQLRSLPRPWRRSLSAVDRIALGALGERVAARHLKRGGYRLLVRDYRCDAGQIDLIAARGATIVFVEVKTRTGDEEPFDGENPVRRDQREQIVRAAKYFLKHPAAQDRPARFDVITVSLSDDASPKIEHVEDAWQPGRPDRLFHARF